MFGFRAQLSSYITRQFYAHCVFSSLSNRDRRRTLLARWTLLCLLAEMNEKYKFSPSIAEFPYHSTSHLSSVGGSDEPPLPPPLGVENVKILKESGVRRDPLQPF